MMQFKSITIKATSCECGGSYAWLGERPSGAWEMIGCVCHTSVRPEWLSGYQPGDELERLRAWKAEALQVLGQWEAVWETAGRPGPLGFSKAASVQALIADLLREQS